ncbi:hypothetical protein HMPREF1565_1652 [Providencia alcalifaciens RIMD 1656011]|uniref:Uncharacterized protein n=1 Tax=Providencia alcalifaciens 205/92 TaxID=1256988 RepID=A0AAV3M6S3_9GAMM|nr:hypothetical protein HMPREF1562_1990 [Providencia alcalifaciens F90-2004]EUC94384.1 hypothetical protein HMPREF1567_1403 [Providencia alcalifaciens PAL-2]EUD02573.1 hypothetical protein HMPREF1565_1652 [Providencia alcalifaciens RIMD 1656011]EUD08207.1 hypothetical protein HMPREF1564_1092 [Providencia alcalifaciens R90-1475]EUD11468.1 hypothetical protein HMPREF1563_0895 [Providencia alcalifaciens 205/92]
MISRKIFQLQEIYTDLPQNDNGVFLDIHNIVIIFIHIIF